LVQRARLVRYFQIFWDAEDDPLGNVEHLAEHGLTPEDVEEVLEDPIGQGVSRSSGLQAAWGYAVDGRYIIVVYEEIDPTAIRVVTAYEVNEWPP
jgi:uncharacterized DUF497 family protein